MPATIDEPWSLRDEGVYVCLTRAYLDVQEVVDRVRSPSAGGIVIFAGKFTNPNPNPSPLLAQVHQSPSLTSSPVPF